jgi:hypothetical protein
MTGKKRTDLHCTRKVPNKYSGILGGTHNLRSRSAAVSRRLAVRSFLVQHKPGLPLAAKSARTESLIECTAAAAAAATAAVLAGPQEREARLRGAAWQPTHCSTYCITLLAPITMMDFASPANEYILLLVLGY